jgi:hypothetical protein
MDSLKQVLRMLFFDNLVVLLLLSLSWIPLYFLLKLTELATGKLLLRYPIFIFVRFWRLIYGIPGIRKAALEDSLHDGKSAEKKASKIGKYISTLDKKISELSAHKHTLGNVVFTDSRIKNETKNIYESDMAMLEIDQAFSEALSKDISRITRGILNIAGNDSIDSSDRIKALFHVLEFGPAETRELCLYLIQSNIKSWDELEKLERIVSEWKGSIKNTANEIVGRVRERLEAECQRVRAQPA